MAASTQHRAFVRGNEPLSSEALRAYFSLLAPVCDVYCPPTRPTIAFVSFPEEESLEFVLSSSELHMVEGA